MARNEMGEELVGAYLKFIEQCDVVDYNVRPLGGGLNGLNELDVIGYNFSKSTNYLCEVTTHLKGLLYKNTSETINRISQKHLNQKAFVKALGQNFDQVKYMFWSPYVPIGKITTGLNEMKELTCIINGEYSLRMKELLKFAKENKQYTGNDAMRVLQIIEHIKS